MIDPAHTYCSACCGDGYVEMSEDILVLGEHSTRDWTEKCEACDGTGVDPECGCARCCGA